MLPNTYIAGTQKAGTTSLYHTLGTHPEVLLSSREEIHFFDLDRNYDRGVAWYESFFFGWHSEKVVLEKSPLYLYESAVPARMYEVTPDAKIIVVLRNPVDRAYSHYWHEAGKGRERLTFEKALAVEQERIGCSPGYRRRYSYCGRGHYSVQIARFLDYFPKSKMLALIFENLCADPHAAYVQCAEFLDIEPGPLLAAAHEKRHRNAARLPRVRWLQRLLRPVRDKSIVVDGVFTRTLDRVNLKTASYPPMDSRLRERLVNEFRGEETSLRQLLDIDVSSWFVSE